MTAIGRRFLILTSAVLIGLLAPRLGVADDGDDPDAVDASQIQKLSDDELRELLAPIALYPDALLAQILPASSFPTQIVAAYHYTQTAGATATPPNNVDWDSSVDALLNYPDVLKKLNDDLEWTEKIGFAATYQMPDVSSTIQQIRSEAEAAGNLVSNDQQVVTTDADNILIEPAQPDAIYVPVYQPDAIFIRHDRWQDCISFGPRYSFGIWLGNTFDWRYHRIGIYSGWDRNRGGWYRPSRPVYWRPPHRPLPGWYRSGAIRTPPVRYTPRGSVAPFGPKRPVKETRPVGGARPVRPPRPAAPARNPRVNEGLGLTGQEIRREASRGEASRRPAPARPAPAPRPAPARPAPAPRPAPARRPAPRENGMRPSNGAAVREQSQRGAASRASSAGRRR